MKWNKMKSLNGIHWFYKVIANGFNRKNIQVEIKKEGFTGAFVSRTPTYIYNKPSISLNNWS